METAFDNQMRQGNAGNQLNPFGNTQAAFPQPTREIDTQVFSAINPLSCALLLTVHISS